MSVSSLICFLKLGTAMKGKISASGVSKLTMKIFTYLPKLKYCACAAWQQLISWAGKEKVKQHVGFDYSPRAAAAAAVITSTIGNQLDRGKRLFQWRITMQIAQLMQEALWWWRTGRVEVWTNKVGFSACEVKDTIWLALKRCRLLKYCWTKIVPVLTF